MSDPNYQLIDFGSGRKLESIAGRIVDRPSPAAEGFQRSTPSAWLSAESRFDSESKSWAHTTQWPDDLAVECGGFQMPVRPTPFGHIGLFPEQQANWDWLQQTSAAKKLNGVRPKALNLFGYTGASTMALVAAGFEAAHVDAAKPNVQTVRSAAELNGWPDAPIRYLVDDAAKFTARERRRERRYHTIVLDPPAYGHSPKGKAWRLERDLWPLLDDCLALVEPDEFRILVTGHSPQVDEEDVVLFFSASRMENASIDAGSVRIQSGRSTLADATGRKLDAGFFVRLICHTTNTP